MKLSGSGPFLTTVINERNKQVTKTKQPKKVAAIPAFWVDSLAVLSMQAAAISALNHHVSLYLGEIHETNLEVLIQLKSNLSIGLRNYTEPFAATV